MLGYFGLPMRSGMTADDWGNATTVILGAISLALVLPLRTSSHPVRWYSRGWGVALLFVGYLLLFGLIALTIRSMALQPFSIPSNAMAPTVVEGDYLSVSKSAYGYSRYSFPFGIIPISGRAFQAEPQRGDVAVFRYPPDPNIDYIKRVIGLPGERVRLADGVVYINDIPIPRVETNDQRIVDGDHVRTFRETLADGRSYLTVDLRPEGSLDNMPEVLVPAGQYFVLGDNRDNSADSRVWGFVPLENFVGPARWVYWNSTGEALEGRQDLRKFSPN